MSKKTKPADKKPSREPSNEPSNDPTHDIDPRLLEILICPLTGGPLDYDKTANELISKKAGLAYPILEGVPIMLVDEAREIE